MSMEFCLPLINLPLAVAVVSFLKLAVSGLNLDLWTSYGKLRTERGLRCTQCTHGYDQAYSLFSPPLTADASLMVCCSF